VFPLQQVESGLEGSHSLKVCLVLALQLRDTCLAGIEGGSQAVELGARDRGGLTGFTGHARGRCTQWCQSSAILRFCERAGSSSARSFLYLEG
jgi:hypothetical protein